MTEFPGKFIIHPFFHITLQNPLIYGILLKINYKRKNVVVNYLYFNLINLVVLENM